MALDPFNPFNLDPMRIQGGPTFVSGLGAGSGGFQSIDPLTGAPPTGLMGSENALTSAADNAIQVLRSGRNTGIGELRAAGQAGLGSLRAGSQRGIDFINQGISGFNPLATAGTKASDIQAALSGALGVDAQRAALSNLTPVSEFLQSRGEQALNRNAAALGGIGGGNVRRELVRFGQGLAGESAQQQFNNLSTVADRGITALRDIGQLRGQQADISLRAGQNEADLLGRTSGLIASSRAAAASNIANVFGNSGSEIAQGRMRAGEQIAQAIGGTSSALSSLISSAGTQQSNSQSSLAAILANIATGQASTVAGLGGIPGTQQSGGVLGGLGDFAGGVGTLLGAI